MLNVGSLSIVADSLSDMGKFIIARLAGKSYVCAGDKAYGPYTEVIKLTNSVIHACNFDVEIISFDIITIQGECYISGRISKTLADVCKAITETMSNSVITERSNTVISQHYLYHINCAPMQGIYRNSREERYIVDMGREVLISSGDTYSGIWNMTLEKWSVKPQLKRSHAK